MEGGVDTSRFMQSGGQGVTGKSKKGSLLTGEEAFPKVKDDDNKVFEKKIEKLTFH